MSFAKDVAAVVRRTEEEISARRRAFLISLFSSVIRDTPVLTGRLRGNWQTSIGAPMMGELPLRPEAEAIREVQDAAGRIQGDATLFLRNNLPYAVPIEFGHSKKHPEGMVGKNVARVTRLMNEAVRAGKI